MLAERFRRRGNTADVEEAIGAYDVSTFLLMTRFYALWRKDGLHPPEALRQAQCWLRDAVRSV
jgi:hypothetical protein